VIPPDFTGDDAGLARRLKRATEKELTDRLALTGKIALDDKGRCDLERSAVVATVSDDCLRASLDDVRRGDGGELRLPRSGRPPSFHSAYSSCALAINAFGPWRLDPSTLTINGRVGFTSLEFEAKFPINLSWKRAPNIDVVCRSAHEVVAIESKLTEHLTPRHTAQFSPRYSNVVESISHSSWADKYEQLQRNPDYYAFFNAAQIIKHYLGLRADIDGRIAGRDVTLLYLYWEPSDAHKYALFGHHRAAVSAFSSGLQDETVRFQAMSYPELWNQWCANALTTHVEQLAGRYALPLEGAIAAGSRLQSR
jgi:hypothetical protein